MDKTRLEALQNIVAMYKKDKITKYVAEREIAKFMGDKTHAVISDDKKNIISKTFGVFVLPERLTDGFHITYVIDSNAIMSFYSEEEFGIVMTRLKNNVQHIFKKYHEFNNSNKENEVSYGDALGFILDLYAGYRHLLRVNEKSDEYLTDDDVIRLYIDKFITGKATKEDSEKLALEEFVSPEILEFVKRYIKRGNNFIRIVDNADEIPTVNMFTNIIKDNVTSTFGIRDHKEIPHDFLPKTNQ